MANKAITMLQIQRILQLLMKGEKTGSICRELDLSLNTVKKYRSLFLSSGLSNEQLLKLDPGALDLIIHPKLGGHTDSRIRKLKEVFPGYVKRLKSTHITRELLWREYRKSHRDGYGYSQFCEHLSRFMLKSSAVMHLVHRPADVLQVDFAGDKLEYVNKETGEIISCPVLVCTLPFSSYTYIEALPNQSQANLIGALNRCLYFLGGVPHNLCSDNLKQVVNKADRYEPKFSELMSQFALYYNISLTATRVAKPKDKASVERHVGIAYSRIYAIVEQQDHFSLAGLNQSIKTHLDTLNNTLMQKRDHCRRENFEQHEKNLLLPLPENVFALKHQTMAKVQRNYHVVLGEDWHNYSVPYQHIGKKVKIIYDTNHVEIYLDMKRIAFHIRSYGKHGYSTDKEHMPENHKISKQIGGYTPDEFLAQAKKIGPFTYELVKDIIENKFFSQQTFKSCLGTLRLKNKYGNQRLEKACQIALGSFKKNYYTVKTILENNRDKLEQGPSAEATHEGHTNIRGEGFYANLFSGINNN